MRVDDIPELGRLTVPEKILLLEELWDSIASEEASVPVPQSHREELDRRLAEYEKDPGRLLTVGDLREGSRRGDDVHAAFSATVQDGLQPMLPFPIPSNCPHGLKPILPELHPEIAVAQGGAQGELLVR